MTFSIPNSKQIAGGGVGRRVLGFGGAAGWGAVFFIADKQSCFFPVDKTSREVVASAEVLLLPSFVQWVVHLMLFE